MGKAFSIRSSLGTLITVLVLMSYQGVHGTAVASTTGSTATPNTPLALLPTSTAEATQDETIPLYQPTITVPPDLHLSGQLVLSGFQIGVARLDFSTQAITSIFQPAENAFVGAAVLSPDQRTYFMIYSPPRDPSDPQYGASSLYTLPADGSGQPSRLLKEDDSGNYYFTPWWSSDGKFVYYGRDDNPHSTGPSKTSTYFLSRYHYPDGPAQDLLNNVLFMRLSADGQKMFYISGDPYTGFNNIYEADPDGSNAAALLPGGDTWIVDSLAISPDDKTIVFSSSDNTHFPTSLSWLDQLMGVGVAQAHNVPSDLYMMTLGGSVTQLTQLHDVGFIEDFSPDGQYIVFSCSSGVFIVRPDGSDQTMILDQPSYGGLEWVP